jgi:hypothetical protein
MKRKPLYQATRPLAILLPLLAVSSASAALPKDVTYSVQPIIGYELQRKDNPDRTKLVLTYGARVIAGYKILSAEAEYTQGKSDENFIDTSTRIEEKSENIRVGLRSTYSVGSLIDWYLRGGAEAQKRNTKRTVSGTTNEYNTPTKVHPYVGTGLDIRLGNQLALTASALATVKDLKDMGKNEYTTSLGVRVNFNTR